VIVRQKNRKKIPSTVSSVLCLIKGDIFSPLFLVQRTLNSGKFGSQENIDKANSSYSLSILDFLSQKCQRNLFKSFLHCTDNETFVYSSHRKSCLANWQKLNGCCHKSINLFLWFTWKFGHHMKNLSTYSLVRWKRKTYNISYRLFCAACTV
jgi:hypothetical protein